MNALHEPLPFEALRWRCRPEDLPFESTRDVEPVTGVIGQEAAVEALRFGLETNAPGQNIFVRGLTGTGRMTLVRRLVREIRLTHVDAADRCFVHNFANPDRPRLIAVPCGEANRFRRCTEDLATFIREELPVALSSEQIWSRQAAIDRDTERRLAEVVEPFEKSLHDAGLALANLQVGPIQQAVLVPIIDGKPIPPEEFEQLHMAGAVSEAQYDEFRKKHDEYQQQLREVTAKSNAIHRQHAEAVRGFFERTARSVLTEYIRTIEEMFPTDAVRAYLAEVIADAGSRRPQELQEDESVTRRYRANVVLAREPGHECPVIIENTPTMANLLGTIDRSFDPGGGVRSDHLMICAGSLLQADGGYLILDARDVLEEPGAWKVLVRTLRTGCLEIVPPEFAVPWSGPSIKPEPIALQIKVILLGDAHLYDMLDGYDPDFPNLFKVLADFDSVMDRRIAGATQYGGILARIAEDEGLPPFDRSAVATLVEHGARIAARSGKLTARFGRLADIAREAAFIATKGGRSKVDGGHVRDAVTRTKRRADLPSRRFRELLADGTIHVRTSGRVVGQINGLAVLRAGALTYGFPARITATIGPGRAGVINIEGAASLSGSIHTKGFYILEGLLRHLLRTDHPLAFHASVAFEQSYGGIDGDSASGAETCCLLSALTDVPLRQDLAFTGAIDQHGHILPVGAINEKIEGFFETCADIGMTGTEGVIIPESNAGDLMLREDIVEACASGRFRVYAVGTIHQALELLTAMPAGELDADGGYAEGTLLLRAVERALLYWIKASPSLETFLADDTDAEPVDDSGGAD